MQEAFLYNVLSLAYLGDAAYELMVRQRLVSEHRSMPGELHQMAQKFVSATAQSKACEKLIELMNDDELNVFNRARNSSPANIPKHSSRSDYHRATALEAVFGYLHLIGDNDRSNEIFEILYDFLQKD